MNTIYGNAGNNRLDGGRGADRMAGGEGDDTYIVDHMSANPGPSELPGEGNDTVQCLGSQPQPQTLNVENLVLTGALAINATGNDLDNLITGNAAAPMRWTAAAVPMVCRWLAATMSTASTTCWTWWWRTRAKASTRCAPRSALPWPTLTWTTWC